MKKILLKPHNKRLEYKKLESQIKEPCILNVIEKETFLRWYSEIK